MEVAFASGTGEPDGTVLIAGTGAVAGAMRDRRLTRTADGHGWLLGDDGSGYWLGREAARATLRTLDAGEPLGPLVASLLQELCASGPSGALDSNDQRESVLHTLNTRAPVQLAELAPLVTAADAAGDLVASRMVDEAAQMLAQTVSRIREPSERTPIVLAGGLAREGSPVGSKLRTLIAEQFEGAMLSAADGVGGAAWLALATADPSVATEEARIRLTAV